MVHTRNKTTKRDIVAPRFIIWSGNQIKGFAITPRPDDPRR